MNCVQFGDEPSTSGLSTFGSVIYSYAGQGRLVRTSGSHLPCHFEIGQFTDGRILALCHVPSGNPYHATAGLATQMNGRTHDGYKITAWNNSLLMAHQPNVVLASGLAVSFVMSFNEARVRFESGSLASAVYSVTNLAIDGISANRGTIPLRLQTQGRNQSALLRRVNRYEDVHKRLQVTRGFEVTAEAVVQVDAHQQLAAKDRVMDRLCHILSVARGTKVNWIAREVRSNDETKLSRYHCARITRPYSEFGAIRPSRDSTTKRFVEAAYPVYVARNRKYSLEEGTIDSYIDARAEEDFLQTRGVKMAVALEALKAVYIREHDENDNIIDGSIFAECVDDIKSAITQAIVNHGVKRKTAKRMASKYGDLNRLAFVDILTKLFKEIGFTPHKDEVLLFAACRNKLVHEGKFYTESASDVDRAKIPPLPTIYDEFMFLANFLDRIMLHLLGYDGLYLDRRYTGVAPHAWRLVTDVHWPHPAFSPSTTASDSR